MKITNKVGKVIYSTREAKTKLQIYPGNSGARKITSCFGE